VKFLFDFFPLILFFVAYRFAGIYVATAAAIAATVAQIGWSLARRHQVSSMQWVSLVIIVLFGGATLLLHDETFIKWKPTVLYWTGAAAFLASLAFGRNLARAVMGAEIELPQAVWTRLCVAWAAFFAFAGAANLYVAYNYATSVWVNFKVFGSFGLIVVFVIAQSLWISRYLPDDDAKPVAIAKANEPPQA
jgi:intracellular septation protein